MGPPPARYQISQHLGDYPQAGPLDASSIINKNQYNFTEEELLCLLKLPTLSPDLLYSILALKEQMPKSFSKILTFVAVDLDALNEFKDKMLKQPEALPE